VSLLDGLGSVRDIVLGLFPHRAATGLVPIGSPGPDAPVLLTGNYTLTVRRMKKALAGFDAWLLVANSKGINVWCAAGGGHLTHHDVISVIRTSGIETRVEHRDIVLPQLAATGVEPKIVTERTGWQSRWGPARLEDLPAFLERGQRVRKTDRFMHFPLRERLGVAAMWGVPMLAVAASLLAWLGGWRVSVSSVPCVLTLVAGPFVALPWLGLGPQARRRFVSLALFATAGIGVGVGTLALLSALTPASSAEMTAVGLILAALLSVDIAGTTPWYPSTINTGRNPATIELVEDRCTGSAECVLVCPRDVLAMSGRRRKVEIRRPRQCIQCGACIVQCPEDALRFRYRSGEVVEAPTIRRTRMNMVGRRTIVVPE
jgi:NAD-dependent dihydropyrimidine dehydrogenase PreA subunit